ncbi:recombinase family protein [Tautonia sociabilis]|uniref:recombinase family protein n=1 Tax=Tautonia sociabilis TaxID=2080755 RepID=UPI001F3560E0|nr:recombinase family protein [Tautonia sociabilis]
MMSEAELHILKQRMCQGKLNKARRGELIARVPAGYVTSPAGEVTLDPDEQARGVIRLIFDEFDRLGTVHGVLRSLIAQGVRLPVRAQGGPNRGQLEWRAPYRETVRHILRHPMYAGAYRYGFRPTEPRRQTPGHPRGGRGSGLAAEDCLVFLKDRFPAYIAWERFEANQTRLTANRSRIDSVGAVRDGSALLAGLVRCGRCGKRMSVRYGSAHRRPGYACSTLRSDYALPLCQSVTAAEVESWVAEQILEVIQPAVLEASLEAAAAVEQRRRQMTRHWEQRIERARYRYTRTQPRPLGEADRDRFRRLAAEVPALWQAPSTTPADRRQVVRLLVERVVLTVDPGDDRVTVRVEWAGGAVCERVIHRSVRGYKGQQSWSCLSERLAALHGRDETPEAIATALDREGFRPPKRASWFTAGMVRRLLHELGLRRRVPRAAEPAGVLSPDERWLHDLARDLALSPHTLHGWRKKGWLHARQVGGRGGP